MKKSSLIVLLLIVTVLCLTLAACGTVLPNSSTGGDAEIHALYQAYAEDGGTLSYEEWLTSIKGAKGEDGVGIKSIDKTETEGLVDTYTITLTNDETATFTVTNGKDGENGKDAVVDGTGAVVDSEEMTDAIKSAYEEVFTEKFESTIAEYREINETLSNRVADLEDAVRQSIAAANANIGAYASVYVDSVLNITCSEPTNINVSGCQGTGFIITEDGYILTNNHVVSYETQEADLNDFRGYNIWGQKVYGAINVSHTYSSIKAAFDGASLYPSDTVLTLEVIYRDAAYDLALCKIVENPPIGEKWNSIPFYEGEVARGNRMLVLGNARGFGYSATAGLVSATGKTFSDTPQLTFIQTDAAINGGNSGGPAINIYGGLIGVVNSKFVSVIKSSYFSSEIEDVEGMGFAIELSKVKEFLAAAEVSASVTVSYKTVGNE